MMPWPHRLIPVERNNMSFQVLALVMEALYVVLSIDQQFTASYEQRITPLTIAVFIKYSSG